MRNDERNVVLIGMPGVGKSTVGVLLAKALSRSFIDTDVHLQAREGRRLQDIIDTDGLDRFRAIEENFILSLDCREHVVATGGSVVYSERAMAHLRRSGPVVYLYLPLEPLYARVTNLDSRGIVMAPGQTFAELFDERQPLYAKHADVTIHCAGLNHDETAAAIVQALREKGLYEY
ncbi:MAG TPA: shikimate kinase [Candidatus Hydrogenedentes bacterium]|nr:shikimate kinase [Candidatus Hydrogenedentota bacterium]HOT50318.1 shikimate kinase [Candidatus Hydrogenedentota bacterium]HOV74910.1 shikimate kinase [Candidatus Hydrogenedentota bacterium]HPC17528.1 shikimate kinase [Candidatus Hydrogenedentota bacterium]HRT20631.1 shikimate kinase [Candidatus Hydrogenedentota bacterium]